MAAVAFFLAASSAEAACSRADIASAAAQVHAAQIALLALNISPDDPTVVSAVQRNGVAGFKDRLAALADAYMACAPAVASAKEVRSDLTAISRAPDKSVAKPQGRENYGGELSFAVKAPAPLLIGIEIDFDIPCGSDSLLLVYQRDGGGWRRAIRWQNDLRDTIAKAMWAFDYAVSPPDKTGAWFVVAKDVAPWCQSTWSEIRHAVLRPATRTAPQKTLASGTDSIWWGGEDLGALAATEDGADIRFHGESIDAGIHNRAFIRHYRVTGDSAQRVQPVAMSPRDFVDEWIISPWSEAQDWSSADRRRLLSAAHKIGDGDGKYGGFGFESAQKCSDAPDHYQIALTPPNEEKPRYFQVRGRTEFTMLSVDRVPAKACAGKNILDTMATK